MNDRELLELAAKAAGYDYRPQSGAIVVDGIPARWNPLEDDGDALRLAVKLRFSLNIGESNSCASWPPHDPSMQESPVEPHESDQYAATRRAIVRAAAEIGKVSHPKEGA